MDVYDVWRSGGSLSQLWGPSKLRWYISHASPRTTTERQGAGYQAEILMFSRFMVPIVVIGHLSKVWLISNLAWQRRSLR